MGGATECLEGSKGEAMFRHAGAMGLEGVVSAEK